MKALIKMTAGPGLTLGELPEPAPGPNDILIKIVKTAICGTDMHIYHWDAWAQKTLHLPMAIGHSPSSTCRIPGRISFPASAAYIAAAAGRDRETRGTKTAAPNAKADRRSRFSIGFLLPKFAKRKQATLTRKNPACQARRALPRPSNRLFDWRWPCMNQLLLRPARDAPRSSRVDMAPMPGISLSITNRFIWAIVVHAGAAIPGMAVAGER